MIYNCEKVFNGVTHHCKRFTVVLDSGLEKIVYYRFYKPKGLNMPFYKNVEFTEDFIVGLYNKENPLTLKEFKSVKKLMNKFYIALQREGRESMCLKTTASSCAAHLDLKINCNRGILLEDQSVIIFDDSSCEQKAYIQSITKRGGL